MPEMKSREVQLPQGTVKVREAGSGPVLLFVHGALVDGRLWDPVVERLAPDARCIVPDLPLGSHRIALNADADVTPRGVAKLLGDLVTALGLEDVTLVGNDTGGAICQVAAAERPPWLRALVLTNCDAFETFPPAAFKPTFMAGKIPGGARVMASAMKVRALRRAPFAYGWLGRDLDDELTADWMRPAAEDGAVRRDLRKLLAGVSEEVTLDAAAKLAKFDRPALIVWGAADKFFKVSLGERLAKTIPGARLVRIEGAVTFVMQDEPDRLAELIAGFVREPVAAPA